MDRRFELKKKLALRRDATPADLMKFYAATQHDRSLSLPVLFHHLRVDIIPQPDGVPNPVTVLAQMALIMLGQSLAESPSCSIIITDIRDHWNAILAWCSFLLRSRMDDPASLLDDSVLGKDTDHFKTMSFLRLCATTPSLLSVMQSNLDLLPLLLHVWRHETKVKGEFISASSLFMILLEHLSTCSTSGCTCDYRPLSILGSLAEDLTMACLHRMRTQQRNPSLDQCKRLYEEIFVLYYCSFEPDGIHRSFLAKGSVALVLRLLHRISPRDADRPSYQASVCSVAMAYLGRCILIDGTPCVLELLEGRLLVLLFKQGLQLQLPNDCAHLLKAIMPHLIHRPILLHARRSLKTIALLDPPGGVDNLSFNTEAADFQAYWTALQQDVTLWNKVRILSLGGSGELRYTELDGCENPTHHTIDSTNRNLYTALKRCGGCEHAHYCSRLCRKEHWDKGHKEECKLLRNHRDTGLAAAMPSSRERVFLHQAVLFDIQTRRHPPEDRAKLVDAPLVVLQRDYTTVPMGHRVIPLAEFDRNGIDDDLWSAALNQLFTPENRGKSVLCCAVIPRGSQPYKMFWVALGVADIIHRAE